MPCEGCEACFDGALSRAPAPHLNPLPRSSEQGHPWPFPASRRGEEANAVGGFACLTLQRAAALGQSADFIFCARYARAARICASTAATAVMLTTRRTLEEVVRMCAGLSTPIRIGPIATPSVITRTML